MPRMSVCRTCAVLTVLPAMLGAQEREASIMSTIDAVGRQAVALFGQPLHPVITGVAPGGGIGGGLELTWPAQQRWGVNALGVYTVRRYAMGSLRAHVDLPRVTLGAFGRVRDLPKLDFFGVGPSSDAANRTNFALTEAAVGLDATVRVAPWVRIGATLEQLRPAIGTGESSDLPDLRTRFGDAEAPGLTNQPRYQRFGGTLDLIVAPGVGEALHQGARYRASWHRYEDSELDRYTFQRLDVEARHRFALFGRLRRLTLQGWLSTTTTAAGQEVPFYLMHTLGGVGGLQPRGEERVGEELTRGTLRGFPHYRFRDRHLLLLQSEYRLPIWGPVEGSLFVEAGKVTATRAELDLSQLERSAGFGLSVMRGPSTAMRLDVGFGGGEGTRVFLSIGRHLIP
jgi:hypothetical protein